MLLRKLMAAFALTTLLTSVSVADTSLCRMICAAHFSVRGSPEPVAASHLHHSAMSQQKLAVHTHASRCTGDQPSIVNCGERVLQSPQCTQYQQVVRFLDASRLTVTEKISGNGNVAVLSATLVEENNRAVPSPPISPPSSYVFPRSTVTLLRI